MISKPRLRFAIGVVLIAAISVAVYSARSRLLPPPPSARAGEQVSTEGGTPVQRQRIDDYIARVAQEDFETLVKNLNMHEDLLVAVFSGQSRSQVTFHRCLANRRLAKIFADLESRPAAEAERVCRSIFKEKFDIHRSDLLEVLEFWERGAQPRRPRPLDENLTALCGAVFLSAAFCPVTDVLRQLEEWEELGRSVQRRAQAIPDPKMSFLAQLGVEHYAVPESLFLLNIYSWMLRDRCRDSDFEQLLPEGLPAERVAFCAWDAHTNPFDFTHQHRGVRVENKRVLTELAFHRVWDVWPESDFAKERNRKLLASLRQRLEECAPGDGD